MASTIYESSRGCIWRRVKGAEFASASPFVCLVLPITRLIAPSLISGEGRTPFREPLQFIVIAVMSVMSDTFPDTYGVST
jgi:hypothetical protein